MAKTLYFTSPLASIHRGNNDAKLAGAATWWQPQALSESRGTGGAATVNSQSIAGTTVGIEFTVGALAVEWISEPLSADFTIAGTITGNMWGYESTMNDNTAINFVVDKIDGATGAITQIAKSARVTELAVTTAAVNSFTVVPTSTACKRGDRLRIRPFIDDIGTAMIVGTSTFSYSGATAAVAGDSYVTFTENLTFETTAPTGSTYYLTDAAESINPGSATEKKALTTRGSGSVNAVTNTAAGPTAGIQTTASAGGTAIEWYTSPLEAFTLGGKAKFNIRGLESSASANASLKAEIAITAGNGSGATVWGVANLDPTTTSSGGWGELSTSETSCTVWVSGDDTAITAGQRLRFRIFLDDCADLPQASGFTVTVSYNGTTSAAAGDTYVILPVAVTEQIPGFAIGRRAAATTVRGITVAPSGVAPISIGSVNVPYSAGILKLNPLAYYRLGESSGTTAVDSSPNGRDGTFNGGTALAQAGVISGNTAIRLDGVDDSVTLPMGLTLPAGNSITVEFWNYVATGDQGNRSAFTFGAADYPNRCQAHVPYSDKVMWWDYGNTPGGNLTTDYTAYMDKWTLVQVTFDSATNKHAISLDGVEVSSKIDASAPTSAISSGYIGRYVTFHKGLIDEFAIYNYALSPAQRLANFNARQSSTVVRGITFALPIVAPIGRANVTAPALLIDQSVATGSGYGIGWQSTWMRLGQTFITGAQEVTITGIHFYGYNTGSPTDNLTVEINREAGGYPAASVATGSVSQVGIPGSPSWVNITSGNISGTRLTANTKYALSIGRSSGTLWGDGATWNTSASDAYAGGQAAQYDGGAWYALTGDFPFRLYGSTVPTVVRGITVVVPSVVQLGYIPSYGSYGAGGYGQEAYGGVQVNGITFVSVYALPVGKVASATSVKGITLVPQPVTFTIGKRAAATTVRGVTLAPQPVTVIVGTKAAATTVRGVTVSPVGAVTVVIGKKLVATIIRGVTVAPAGAVTVVIGRKAASTVVSGVTVTPAPATITIGRKASATVVKGVTVSPVGAVTVVIGKRAVATTVRGVTIVPAGVAVTIGKVGGTGLLDNYNRANSANLGANWQQVTSVSTSTNRISISGNEAKIPFVQGSDAYLPSTYGANQEASFTLRGTDAGGGTGPTTAHMYLLGQMPDPAMSTFTGYVIDFGFDTGSLMTVTLYRGNAGAYTNLQGVSTVSYATGDVLTYRKVGSTITILRNGSAISGWPITDPAPLNASGTYIGAGGYQANTLTFDDFSTAATGTATVVRGVTIAAPAATIPIGKVDGALTLPVTSGLGMWLDASKLALANDADVFLWPDSSGLGHDVSCRVGTDNPPAFKTNVYNGLPVIRFVHANAEFLFNSTSMGTVGEIFVVAKYNSATFADYDGLFGDTGVLLLLGNSGLSSFYPSNAGSPTYYYNGVDSTSTRQAPMGVLGVCGFSFTPFAVTPVIGVDRFNWPRFWDGDMAEIVAYDHVLTSPERTQVNNYLTSKWITGGGAAGTSRVRGITISYANVNIPVTLSATMTLTPALARTAKDFRTLAVAMTVTPAMTRVVKSLRTVAVTATLTPALSKLLSLFKAAPATVTLTPAMTRLRVAPRAIPATVTLTPVMTRKVFAFRTLALSLVVTPTISRNGAGAVTAPLTVTLTPTMNKLMKLSSAQPVSVTFIPVMARKLALLKTIPATTVISPALSRQAFLSRAFAVSMTLTSVLSRRLSLYRTFAASGVLTPTLAPRVAAGRLLAASTAILASMTKGQVRLRTVSGSLILTGAISFLSGKGRVLNATTTLVPTLKKLVAKNLNAALNFLPKIQRKSTTTLAASITLTPALAKQSRVGRIFGSVVLLQVGLAIGKKKGISLSVPVPLVATMIAGRVNRVIISASVNFTALLNWLQYHARATVDTLLGSRPSEAQLLAVRAADETELDSAPISDEEITALLSAYSEKTELGQVGEDTPSLRSVT